MTPARIDMYTLHMRRYLSNLIDSDLYPATNVTPYQHMAAAHMPDLFRHFGPTSGQRCWPFERANRKLQDIPTNLKLDEMEKTMLERFCGMQWIFSVMSGNWLPESLEGVASVFNDVFTAKTHGRGTLSNDITAFSKKLVVLPPPEHVRPFFPPVPYSVLLARWASQHSHDLSSAEVRQHKELIKNGVSYQPASVSVAQSNIIVCSSNSSRASQILAIFTVGAAILLVVSHYEELSSPESKLDHYRNYPVLGGRIYVDSEMGMGQLDLINTENISAHFARVDGVMAPDLSRPHFLALPLNRD
ncbi:hypothetical protein HGRIS_014844 [Hohenbuehelia grisea]|uniref:Uncharacterized protein n=1 Tax=Hohenbuehelia grisea TaxID=104357 RepID=A0ABR3IQY6_9AGAR